MWRYLFIASSLALSATQTPALMEKLIGSQETNTQYQAGQKNTTSVASLSHKKPTFSGKKVRLKANSSGHFITEVRMNNRPVRVLVDTGATMVAINETTARKLGIRLKPSDFKHKVNTANGVTKMASATIREIRIGNIRVMNVRAGISRDKSLSGTLLGMSFLRQLRRFEVSNGELLMEQ